MSLMAGRSSNTKSSTSPGKYGTVEKKVRTLKQTNERQINYGSVYCLSVSRFSFIIVECGAESDVNGVRNIFRFYQSECNNSRGLTSTDILFLPVCGKILKVKSDFNINLIHCF